jgi:phosphatidylglycerophosphatase B
MVVDADAHPSGSDRRLLGIVLSCLYVGALLTPLLPRIALDTGFADAVVRLTDTASWTLLTPLAILAIVALVARRGSTHQRRIREAASLSLVMLIALAGNALLNEHVVKPAFGVPRPNIVHLTESGTLGPDLPDATAFYATGDKQTRREVLSERLPERTTPQLSETTRAHWIHETGYSFPSGHTTAAITFAVLLMTIGEYWLEGWRRAVTRYGLPLWALAVAASRTLLEVHTGWDVIGGVVAGFIWGGLGFLVAHRLAGDQRAVP